MVELSFYEKFMIGISVFAVIAFLLLVIVQDNSTVAVVSDYAIIFTHIFILPTIYICLQTVWLYVLLLITSFFSILFHLAKLSIKDYAMYEMADLASQGVLVWVTMMLFLFNDMPPVGLGILFVVAIILSVAGEEKIYDVDVDTVVCSIPMLIVLLYVLHKLLRTNCSLDSNYWVYKRKYIHVFVALLFFTAAYVMYTVAGSYEKENNVIYNLIHAGWHTCAYSALYFVFASRKDSLKPQLDEIRIIRTDFAVQ